MDLSSYMEETTLDLSSLSFVEDDENSSDFVQAQQQPANLFMPRHQNQEQQQQQEEEEVEADNMDFSPEEWAAIQAINEFFETAPPVDQFDSNFENSYYAEADQNLNYLEEQQSSSQASFDDESIYTDEGQMFTEFEDLDSNNLMVLTTEDEEDSFEMEDDDESFHRVPSAASAVSARYAQFPQP